jgi:hypothetical protein
MPDETGKALHPEDERLADPLREARRGGPAHQSVMDAITPLLDRVPGRREFDFAALGTVAVTVE